MEDKKDMNYKNILIINLAGIGDLLLSVPALQSLRRSYPDAVISMLTTEKVYDIAKDLDCVDHLYIFDMSYGGGLGISNVIKHMACLIKLRNEKFDIAVNMRTLVSDKSAKKMHWLLKIIHPKKTAGRDTEKRGDFFDIKIPETQIGQKYESEYDLDTVRALGATVLDESIEFKIASEEMAFIEEQLQKQNIKNDALLIGIHPGGMPSRRWSIDRFVRLIEIISKEMDILHFHMAHMQLYYKTQPHL